MWLQILCTNYLLNQTDMHAFNILLTSTTICFWPSWTVLEIKTWLWMGRDNLSSSKWEEMEIGTTALSWSLEDPPPPLSLPLKDICNRNDMIENMLEPAGGFILWWLCLEIRLLCCNYHANNAFCYSTQLKESNKTSAYIVSNDRFDLTSGMMLYSYFSERSGYFGIWNSDKWTAPADIILSAYYVRSERRV